MYMITGFNNDRIDTFVNEQQVLTQRKLHVYQYVTS